MTRRSKSKRRPSGGPPSPANRIASKAPSADTASPRWLLFAISALLALAVWMVFGQTRHFDFVNYDDDAYIYENLPVTQGISWANVQWAFTHGVGGNWHPLTVLFHMLDCQLYGLNPGCHHLTSVALHGLASIALFLALRRLTGAVWRSAFVAGVFAIHPLHVESVVWAAERKDVLSGLFFVLTLWAYSAYVQNRQTRISKARIGYAAALVLFALGLMSKPMLVTLPCILLLLDFWPLKRFSIAEFRPAVAGRLLLEKLPFFALVAADCFATLKTQQTALESGALYGLGARVGNALASCVEYLIQMVHPVGLAVLYPHPGNHLPFLKIGLCLLLLLLISVAALLQHAKRPYLLTGWLWYLGMLVPVIGLIQVGQQSHADRYTYLPQIGLYILLTWGAVELCSGWRHRGLLLGSAAIAILVSLMASAYVQTTHWKDSITLWTHTLAHTSGNYMAENNLGTALARQGRTQEAIGHFNRAIQCLPEKTGYSDPHSNLGVLYADQGRWAEAIQHYEQAVAIKPENANAEGNWGLALTKLGRLEEAVRHFERACQLQPENPSAHFNLANALRSRGKTDAALREYEAALQLKPDYAEAHHNLGDTLSSVGRVPEAIRHFEWALQIKPDFIQPHINLGLLLAGQQRWPEAVAHLQQALDLSVAQHNPALAALVRPSLQAVQAARSKAKP